MRYKASSIVILLAIICIAITPWNAAANNIAITDVSLTDLDVNASNICVQFDISWDNSWRTASNWDAAWVFVKYRLEASNAWLHANLATSGHVAAAGSTITNSDAAGAFIYRSSTDTGNVNYAETKLRWEYGDAGLQEGANVEVCVFAIEMVYIAGGTFELGSGGTESGHFYESPTTTNTYTVSSTNAITVGTAGGNLYYDPGGQKGDGAGPIPSDFPKGYKAIYCMKYEISQGQYADFLNKLTDAQDHNRYPAQVINRHTINGTFTNYVAAAPDRACNYIGWLDGCAYADWSGLRPMTELEFEKICRGTQAAVPNEQVWGSTSVHSSTYTLNNDGESNAVITNPGSGTGNAWSSATDGSLNGPARCGIFAASTVNPTKAEAGATYYGVMEMGGNLAEFEVTVGHSTGRSFKGTHGDGTLTAAGAATNGDWPSTGAGTGIRGGRYSTGTDYMRTSDRVNTAIGNAGRFTDWTFRCVRTAP